MVFRLRSVSRIASLTLSVVVLAGSCGDDEECGTLAALCADEGRLVSVATRVIAAAEVQFEVGESPGVFALTSDGPQLAFATRDGKRTMMMFRETPLALARLEREVAVSFAEPPVVAIFGVDEDRRLERRRDIALTGASASLVSGDLDGDGRLELIAAMHEDGRVAVIDPRSGEAQEYRAGKAPTSLALGDVDGDSHLDVVAVDTRTSALQVLRGAGDGRLMKGHASEAHAQMLALTLADHDGDGDLDALTRDDASNVRVHRNNGAGTFSSPISLPLGDEPAAGVGLVAGPAASGGLVGVGVPQDEALGTWFGKGATWLGHLEAPMGRPVTWVGGSVENRVLVGGEGFVDPLFWLPALTPIEVWRNPSPNVDASRASLTTGDLDGDHLLDVVAAKPGQVIVFRGRADLGLEAISYGSVPSTQSVAIAELTGDGRPDVLVGGEQSLLVAVGSDVEPFVWRSAEPTAITSARLTPLRTGPDTAHVVIATAAREETTAGAEYFPAALLRFGADGALLEERVFGEGLGVGRVIAVDFDEDGVDEPLVLAERDGAPVLVHAVPDGDGYALGQEHDIAALLGVTVAGVWLERMVAGDLDRDGAPEVVLSSAGAAIVVSGMADDMPIATVLPEVYGASDLRDVDGDGLLDGVHTDFEYSFFYHRGLGDGSFETSTDSYDYPRPAAAALAARADAQFDLVTLGADGLKLHLIREVVRLAASDERLLFHGGVAEFATADFDQDGYDDLLTACRQSGGGLAVLRGDKDGGLARADGDSLFNEHSGLTLGDLDGDGLLEALAATDGWYVLLYRLWPDVLVESVDLDLFVSGETVEDLAIADVDADGLPDVLAIAAIGTGESAQMALYVAYGTEPLRFTEWQPIGAVPALSKGAVAVGDVDGDDDLDVLIRPVGKMPSTLVRATGAREWAEAETMPGYTALFGPPDADGRVDLITHQETTVYRHVDGDLERREALVTHNSLVEGALRQVGDADGDGRYDFVVTDEFGTYVWLRGDDGPARIQVADVRLAGVQFPDVDGDGRPDLVGLTEGKVFVRRTRR